jgi:hypothetical protein
METVKIPKFESETEEANWLFENRDKLANAFVQAATEGKVGPSSQRSSPQRPGGVTPPTTIRLAPEDISRARALAERRGLRYQTYLKMLIHEALEREEMRAS